MKHDNGTASTNGVTFQSRHLFSYHAGLLRMRITAAWQQLSLPIPACFATRPAFSSFVTYRSFEVTPLSTHDAELGFATTADWMVMYLAVEGKGSSTLMEDFLPTSQSPASAEPMKDHNLELMGSLPNYTKYQLCSLESQIMVRWK